MTIELTMALIGCLYIAVAVVAFVGMLMRERPSLEGAFFLGCFCLAWPLVVVFGRVRW